VRGKLAPLAAAALAAFGAAGCGSTVAVGRARVLRLGVSEFRVSPAASSAPAGRLTVVVRNYGRLSHNLVIARGSRVLAETDALPPGTQAQLQLTLRPGSYTLSSTSGDGSGPGGTASLTVG
jgi:hypothetical protein